MSDNKHNSRRFGGKGYYIALILCAAAIGITGYLYQKNADQQEVVLQDPTIIWFVPAARSLWPRIC